MSGEETPRVDITHPAFGANPGASDDTDALVEPFPHADTLDGADVFVPRGTYDYVGPVSVPSGFA